MATWAANTLSLKRNKCSLILERRRWRIAWSDILSFIFPCLRTGTLAILVKSGLGVKRALLFNFIPIVLSYVGFGFGVFLDNVDDSYDSFIFSISAGMYFYIFLGTLVSSGGGV